MRMTRAQLRPLNAGEAARVHNGFAEVLRRHHVSDKETAFRRFTTLLLAKIFDERGPPDEVPQLCRQPSESDLQLTARMLVMCGRARHALLGERVMALGSPTLEGALLAWRGSGDRALLDDALDRLVQESAGMLTFVEGDRGRNAAVVAALVELLAPLRLTGPGSGALLGNLFELLLSAGLRQSEGQYFTPQPVTDMIVAAMPPGARVIDPACGAAHFLVSAGRAWPDAALCGVERDQRLARVAQVGLQLHGLQGRVTWDDGLAPRADDGTFDRLLANPPFSIKAVRAGVDPSATLELLQLLTDKGAEVEALFVERAAQLLTPGGLAALILPASVLGNGSRIGVATRRLLLERFAIRALVELPGATFIATTSPAVLLFLERREATVAQALSSQVLVVRAPQGKAQEKAWLGYGWSRRRGFEGVVTQGEGHLQHVAGLVRAVLEGRKVDVPPGLDAADAQLADLVDLEDGLRMATTPALSVRTTPAWPTLPLGELMALEYGKALPAAQRVPGDAVVMGANGPVGSHHEALVQGPVVIVGRKGSAGAVNLCEGPCWPIDTTFWVRLLREDLVRPAFLPWLLRWLELPRLVGRRGAGAPGLNRRDVLRSVVPLVPLSRQDEVLAGLEGIDGERVDAASRRSAWVEQALTSA